jgi:hypothetical protein
MEFAQGEVSAVTLYKSSEVGDTGGWWRIRHGRNGEAVTQSGKKAPAASELALSRRVPTTAICKRTFNSQLWVAMGDTHDSATAWL